MVTGKTHQKTYLTKGHATEKRVMQEPPFPPLKEQSQDWQPGQGIRDTPLVPGGTVADINNNSKVLTNQFKPILN